MINTKIIFVAIFGNFSKRLVVAAAAMSAAAVSLSFSMVAAAVSCLPMSVSFPMVVTLYIRIVREAAVQKCLHSRVRAAADTTVELYACFRERGLRAAADAAADQHIHAALRQKTCQRAAKSGVPIKTIFICFTPFS